MNEPVINVIVREKKAVVFNGPANRISSVNEKGPFDIYPYHANFVAVISQQIELQTADNKIRQFPIPRGILHVKENRVEVYIGI